MIPTWRKPFGMFLILAIIAIWAVIVASQADRIAALPQFVQIIVYVFAGIVWITPMRPLLRWMETGQFSRLND
jgi:predicted membrane channel-forming protein YqfA (hemolysin III family)